MSARAAKNLLEPEQMASPALQAEQVNILVVDDLAEKLEVYRTILEELGQNLVTVSSGEEALRLVLKHEFAVILLDVNMPGMDGFETANLIRQRKKSARTPIIFLTAFTDEVYAAQGYASGAVDYLPTPVVPDILKAKVRVFIELHQMRRQAAMQAVEQAKRAAAEASARRSAFLAKASELLGKAQFSSDIAQVMAEFPIPYLSDSSIVWLAETESQEGHTTIGWADANGSTHYRILPSLADYPWFAKAIRDLPVNGQHILAKSPFPLVLPPLEEDGAAIEVKAETVLILPLSSRGSTYGVLAFIRTRAESLYQMDDIALGSDLAARASAALENTVLVERVREADRRKDEFLGMLAHELRNPLGPIRNAIQLLKMMGASSNPREHELHDIIDRQVLHMVRLIDDLLDATRLAHGKILLRKESCDLCKIVRQTVDDYHSIFDASGLQLNVEVPDKLLCVEGDPTRLVQAIGNLLHNAHKFTNPGGNVTVRLVKQNGNAVVTVEDNGIGIDPKMLGCVFDVFRQAEQGLDRSRGGLGLGLALVKGLVALHEGKVSAQSKGAGRGSTFTIQLPLKDAAAAISSPASTDIPEGEKYRILLIEDNQDMAESARLLLSLEGYEVRTAYSGSDGLESARSFRPQVILCDIGLPGMDGYQVARTIRQDKDLSSTYVIALTGYGRDEDQRQAQEAGFDIHMIKPIDYKNLRRTLAHLSL